MTLSEIYMKRCLRLAEKSLGKVAPNPLVGCVIVYDNKVIGEGYHRQYGGAHAEVNAINSVKDKSRLKGATLYVNLEPCSHYGKTPPCTNLIIRYKIRHVVIGTMDPNPLVAGKGMRKLVSAGCDVKLGVLEDECRDLNKRFFTYYEKKRPYIILKWAQTYDGYIGLKGKRLKITGPASDKLVHTWRSQEQAIMVGTHTAIADNPFLTVRKVKGRTPLRIAIDRNLDIPAGHHLLDRKAPTLIITGKKRKSLPNLDYLTASFSSGILKKVLKELYVRKIQSLIVEGGANLLNRFIAEELWDEARVLAGKNKVKAGGKRVNAPFIIGEDGGIKKIGTDTLGIFKNTGPSS